MASVDFLYAQIQTPHDLSLLEQHSRSLRAQAFTQVMQAAGRSISALCHRSFAFAPSLKAPPKPH